MLQVIILLTVAALWPFNVTYTINLIKLILQKNNAVSQLKAM